MATKTQTKPIVIGDILRGEREKQGLKISDAAEATCLRVVFIEAIEDNRLDEIPSGIYRHLYLKSYCDFLGLDIDDITDEVDNSGNKKEKHIKIEENSGSHPSAIVISIAVVLLLAVLIFALSGINKPALKPVSDIVADNIIQTMTRTDSEIAVISTEKTTIKLQNSQGKVELDTIINTGDIIFLPKKDGLILNSENLEALEFFAGGQRILSIQNLTTSDKTIILDRTKMLANIEINGINGINRLIEHDDAEDIKAAFDKVIAKRTFGEITPDAGQDVNQDELEITPIEGDTTNLQDEEEFRIDELDGI